MTSSTIPQEFKYVFLNTYELRYKTMTAPIPLNPVAQTLKEKIEFRKQNNIDQGKELDKVLKMLEEHPEFEEFVKILQQNGVYF